MPKLSTDEIREKSNYLSHRQPRIFTRASREQESACENAHSVAVKIGRCTNTRAIDWPRSDLIGCTELPCRYID